MKDEQSPSGVMEHIPDLLNAEPRGPRDRLALQKMLQFAFASGESGGALRRTLADLDVSESSWTEDCFVTELFIDELLEGCFQLSARRFGRDFKPPQNLAYLKKVLVHPPSSEESVRFRQEIQQELLGDQELRSRFEIVYRRLAELRAELDSAGVMGSEYSTRRRIEILVQIKETVDVVSEEFGASSSGIVRVREWAQEFRESEGYALLRDFVDYEGRLSSVQLKLRVGVDGSVRSFVITELEENAGSEFYQSPFQRFWSRLGLFLRGYKVGRDELVARVVERVFDAIDGSLSYFLPLIGHMEFHLAALAFIDTCADKGLETCYPEFKDNGEGRQIRRLFNPLLFHEETPPVPCDLEARRSDAMMVITGPNSGGKTRLLQAVGMMQLLGQGGVAVPARRATIRFRPGMFLSLIENATADQEEGRLGTELLRVRRLFEQTSHGSLIILDELCSGTNPSEGEEIFLLVLSLLKELSPEVFITTHFLRFAEQLAQKHPDLDLEFLQVELDGDEEPTYQFVPGVARTSLAGRTAKRLGVTRERLRELIERNK